MKRITKCLKCSVALTKKNRCVEKSKGKIKNRNICKECRRKEYNKYWQTHKHNPQFIKKSRLKRAQYRDKNRKLIHAKSKKQVEMLDDYYVKRRVAQELKFKSVKEIPNELIQVYKAKMLLNRTLKQIKK